MKRKLLVILIGPLLLPFFANAVDTSERVNDIQQFGKWYYAEFTMPTTIAYRIGVESNLSKEKLTLYIDISPLTQCKPGPVTINQFIGYKQMDLPPFFPISYKISGQEKQDSITRPTISEGFFFTPIESLTASDLLKTRGKGNFSFWITPPAESKDPTHKAFFSLNGFPEAYNKAIHSCKDNM
ncbi:TPA: hypothetical protein KKK90_004545 [Escherichia coli]|nr:hypothetical protein [Escherichia coli]HBD5152741.1 hypothetical protein [Escherichia coli]